MNSKDFYDAHASSYDERHDNLRTRYMRKIENSLITNFASGKVLDIGCGTVCRADVGLDISAAMLKEAEKKGNSTLAQGAAENLPFSDNSFDSVLCMFTVLNLCDYEKAVAEVHRVLKKGGIAIISTASLWDHSRKGVFSRIMSRKRSHMLKMRIEKSRFKFFAFAKEDLIKLFAGFRLLHFSGIFIIAHTYWGWQRDFSFAEKTKLKIAFLLDKILQPFNRAARMYFAVFEKL